MDGTLIDTEPYWIAAETELVHAAGGHWTTEDGLNLVGNDLAVSAQYLLDHTPLQGTAAQVVDLLLDRVIRAAKEHLPWRPGARELLLQGHTAAVPMALVTMSYTSLAQVLVDSLPTGTFSAVVTGDQVSQGKPHPESYLTAAHLLGVAPGDCVAIEDSPTGTRSSTAAGVPTVVVPHAIPVPASPGTVQIPSLQGLTLADLATLAQPLRTAAP